MLIKLFELHLMSVWSLIMQSCWEMKYVWIKRSVEGNSAIIYISLGVSHTVVEEKSIIIWERESNPSLRIISVIVFYKIWNPAAVTFSIELMRLHTLSMNACRGSSFLFNIFPKNDQLRWRKGDKTNCQTAGIPIRRLATCQKNLTDVRLSNVIITTVDIL